MLESLINGIKQWVLSLPKGVVISETPPEDPSVTSYINPYEDAFTEDEIVWVTQELEQRLKTSGHRANKILATDNFGNVIEADHPDASQADWNETDELSPSFIKNKPFRTIVPDEVIVSWDGQTEGLTLEKNMFFSYVKISDTPSLNITSGTYYAETTEYTGRGWVRMSVIQNEKYNTCFETRQGRFLVINVLENCIYNDPLFGASANLTAGVWIGYLSVMGAPVIHKLIKEGVHEKMPASLLPNPTAKEGTGFMAEAHNGNVPENASGHYSHAEGLYSKASGMYAHAEGFNTTSSGSSSHAEGNTTIAEGAQSHAEGNLTIAKGLDSHAEGNASEAIGNESHAEGIGTKAQGGASHAEGSYTIATADYQHVQGVRNVEDTEKKYLHIVGNGSEAVPSNAHTVDKQGNAWFSGDVYIGSESGTNMDSGSKKLATEEYVVDQMSSIEIEVDETLSVSGQAADAKAAGDAIAKAEEKIDQAVEEMGSTIITNPQNWTLEAQEIARDNIGAAARPEIVLLMHAGDNVVHAFSLTNSDDNSSPAPVTGDWIASVLIGSERVSKVYFMYNARQLMDALALTQTEDSLTFYSYDPASGVCYLIHIPIDDSVCTLELVDLNADDSHSHDEMYYTETEIDEKISEINSSIENVANEIGVKLTEAKNYANEIVNNAVSQKSQVQIITWEADD